MNTYHNEHKTTKNPIEYLESSFYNGNKEVEEFIKNLIELETKKKHKYKPYHLVSEKLPLWLLIDEMAFGQLRMIMKLTSTTCEVAESINITTNKRKLIMYLITVNEYRNIICHANPLSAFSTKTYGKKHYLNILIEFIKNYYHEDYLQIKQKFDEFDWSNNNIDKNEIISKLQLTKFYKKMGP